MEELIGLARRHESLATLRAINMLDGLLLELADVRHSTQLPEDPWLQKVLARLDAEWNPDLAAVANTFGLSETALRRRFKQATGLTMQQHVLQRRMAAARALLSDTDLPLKAIAAQLNYQNVYFFSRQFRQLCGVPPGVFRSSRVGRK
jgi:AraC-like DNA-binding protein